jgi:hypothetical protein
MPDRAMCSHNSCPLASGCLRNTKSGTRIKPHGQVWFAPLKQGSECEYFIDVKRPERRAVP